MKPTILDPQSLLVSVVISARNEENSLGKLILESKESLSLYPYELIVVDDGSSDGTRKIALGNSVTVVSHDKNLGKGAAMRSGVQNASGDVLVFLDSDGAHDPKDIPAVIAPILERKADLVIGSRVLPESRVPKIPLARWLANKLASLVISVIISFLVPLASSFRCSMKWVRITDCTSGFRAIRRECWQKLNLVSNGFQVETEMIYEVARSKFIITEVPIGCNWNSEVSNLSILRDSSKTLKLLAQKLVNDGH